jgi:hypothetical protein
MAHQDKGHYAKKHQRKKINKEITKLIQEKSDNSNLSCAAAHKLAKELNISPLEIGIQTDLMEFRITHCQLGLFGYQPEKKRIDPSIDIPAELEDRIDSADDNGRIPCETCWQIAEDLKIKKLDLGSSCEKKGVRIKPCQLGAF